MSPNATRTFKRWFAFGTIAAALTACQSGGMDTDAQPAPGDGVVLSDAEVASVVMTANTGEIQQAQLALQKSRNDAVRQFAQRMITDHTNLNQRLMAIDGMAGTDGMRARSTLTQQLMTNTQETMQVLQGLEGEQFNRTYMQTQVDQHRWLLDTLDDALIPSARDSQLERTLTDARPIVASHLQQAQQIQGTLD